MVQRAWIDPNAPVHRPHLIRYIIAAYSAGTAFFAFSRAIWWVVCPRCTSRRTPSHPGRNRAEGWPVYMSGV